MAEDTGISHVSISRWLGKKQDLRISDVERLARAVKARIVVEFDVPPPRPQPRDSAHG